jgi:hypothetical protein
VAGEANATLAVVDLTAMQVAAGVAGRRLIRDGDISMPHAHAVSVDPRTHLVSFPLENLDGRPILRIMSGTSPSGAPSRTTRSSTLLP